MRLIHLLIHHFYNHSAGKLIIDLVNHMTKYSNIEIYIISSFQKKDKMTEFFINSSHKVLDFSNTLDFNLEYFNNVWI